MKDVNEDEDDDDDNDNESKDPNYEMSSSNKSSSKKFDSLDDSENEDDKSQDEEDVIQKKEITGMQLIWEDDYIMMICSDRKTIYVYDEDDTEESELLRKITGSNKEEITIVRYDDHLSLIAAGSIDGEVSVFDFEMSKLEGICPGHTGDITGIEFLAPYPLMITSSMDCTLCLWGVRPAPIAYKYICLYRFTNISWNFSKDSEYPISRIYVM